MLLTQVTLLLPFIFSSIFNTFFGNLLGGKFTTSATHLKNFYIKYFHHKTLLFLIYIWLCIVLLGTSGKTVVWWALVCDVCTCTFILCGLWSEQGLVLSSSTSVVLSWSRMFVDLLMSLFVSTRLLLLDNIDK